MVATPIGMLMKKIQCHPKFAVMTPPISKPIDPPAADMKA